MNPLKNPIFLMGGLLLIFGALAHSTEEIDTYLLWAGGGLILVSFFVHVKPLQIGSLN